VRDLSRSVRCGVFVLTGAGDRVFVSGADVREFRDHLATPESALSYDAAAEQLQSALREAPQPVYRDDPGFMPSAAARLLRPPAIFELPSPRRSLEFRWRNSASCAPFRTPCAWCNSSAGQGQMVADDRRTYQGAGGAGDRPDRSVVEPEELKAQVDALVATLAANAPLTIKATNRSWKQ